MTQQEEWVDPRQGDGRLRVLKWAVPVDDHFHMIGDGRVLHVDCQGDPSLVYVWTLEPAPTGPAPMRPVQVFGTGQELPEGIGAGYHIGSVVTAGGSLVWHVFQVPS